MHTLQQLYAHLAIQGNYLNETGEYPRTNIRWSDDGSHLVGRHAWVDHDKVINNIYESDEYKLCNAEDDAKEKAEAFLVALDTFCADHGVEIFHLCEVYTEVIVEGITFMFDAPKITVDTEETDNVSDIERLIAPEPPLAYLVTIPVQTLTELQEALRTSPVTEPEPVMLASVQGADMEACKAEADAMQPTTDTDTPF